MANEIASSIINGTVLNKHLGSNAEIDRSKLALESKKFAVDLAQLRIFDSASNAVLPNTAASDDLGLILGTLGTSGHSVRTSDADNTTVTQKAAFTFSLPAEYEDGGTISLVSHAGMVTNPANGTATIDFSVYVKDPADFSHGSDLVTTNATTINSTTLADKSFTVNPAGLVSGDELSALVTIAITDTATGAAVIGAIAKLHWLIQVRG